MYRFPHISRRRFLQAATTASLALAGSACDFPGFGGKTEIVYWDWFVDEAPWLLQEIQLFQQVHRDITITKITHPSHSYNDRYIQAFKEHKQPDVAMIPTTPAFARQIKEGWYQPINQWINEGWKQRFPTRTFHEGDNVFQGKIYSAPFMGKTPWLQLYIHNKVFKQVGLVNKDGTLKLPQTWDDVTKAAEIIQEKSSNIYGLGFGNNGENRLPWWLHLFVLPAGSTGGAYEMDYRVGKYMYGSDRNYVDWLKLLLEWKKRGYIYPDSMVDSESQVQSLFARGQIGMIVGSTRYQAQLRTNNHFQDYSMVTLIGPETRPKAYFPARQGGHFIAISASTRYPDAAWSWLDWLYSEETGRRWVTGGYDISIFEKSNNPLNFKYPSFAQYALLLKQVLPAPDVCLRNPDTSNVQPEPVTPDMGNILADIYTGQISDIQGALSELAGRLQEAHETAIKVAQQQGAKVSINDYIFRDWDSTKPYYLKTNNMPDPEPRRNR